MTKIAGISAGQVAALQCFAKPLALDNATATTATFDGSAVEVLARFNALLATLPIGTRHRRELFGPRRRVIAQAQP